MTEKIISQTRQSLGFYRIRRAEKEKGKIETDLIVDD